MSNCAEFDELAFFAQVKRRPGMFFGRKSLIGLRDHLFGMGYAFSVCGYSDAMGLFKSFVKYCNHKLFLTDQNGYACWWNHLLYVSGGMDDGAFDLFYREFETYLHEVHDLKLPDIQ